MFEVLLLSHNPVLRLIWTESAKFLSEYWKQLCQYELSQGKDGSGELYKLNEKSLLPCTCLMNAQVSSLHHLGAGFCVTGP